jgi:bifunctional non-homologous end joining protein LigD
MKTMARRKRGSEKTESRDYRRGAMLSREDEEHLRPMLASPGSLPSDETAYGFEYKWDGARCLALVDGKEARLRTRNDIDVTTRYPELGVLATLVAGRRLLLDGEIVALDAAGRPSFARLQRRMHLTDPGEIARASASVPVALMLFDILAIDGRSLLALPYAGRREILDGLALHSPAVATPPWYRGNGAELLEAAERHGLEGVIAKRLDSTYRPGVRSDAWIKVKVRRQQEFVVAGYVPGRGSQRGRVGSLLLGYYRSPAGRGAGRRRTGLQYAGNVGTGFSDRDRAALKQTLDAHRSERSPFESRPRADAVYAEPLLVAEVAFHEWTGDGMLRHPVFLGLRDDKSPEEVRRET